MLKRQDAGSGVVEVTFVVPEGTWAAPVSVVGDFNDWDPFAHPLRRRSNGTRSVKVRLGAGRIYRFKYLGDGGTWFCEPDADRMEPDDHHRHNSVLEL